MDIITLKKWFQEKRRDLPWRSAPTPYRVWISEVMLQQTQVSVVIPYFNRWMEQFPSITHLAESSLEDVIKAWEGLGYYSRARNIHAAALYLVKNHGGNLPSSREELEKIKGFGPYTVGAILSFAFHQKAAAVDANVERLFARFYLIEEVISSVAMAKRLRAMVEGLLPEEESWVIMEAFIELGAMVCKKRPQCALCPLKSSCLGALTERAVFLPNKRKQQPTIFLKKETAILLSGEEILLKKGGEGVVMADLYEFPYFAHGPKEEWGLEATCIYTFPSIRYSYTRYRVELIPTLWQVTMKKWIEGYSWITLKEASKLPFSSGHRKLLHQLLEKIVTIQVSPKARPE